MNICGLSRDPNRSVGSSTARVSATFYDIIILSVTTQSPNKVVVNMRFVSLALVPFSLWDSTPNLLLLQASLIDDRDTIRLSGGHFRSRGVRYTAGIDTNGALDLSGTPQEVGTISERSRKLFSSVWAR